MGPGGGNVWEIYFNPKRAKVGWVWVKPIAAIAQIVSGMRALVWTELATDRSKHARLTLAAFFARKYDGLTRMVKVTRMAN